MRTGYQCDINFSDSYGILNSPIVARLLTFDARIYVLATILKYWTKVHDCSGKNRISNYAIVWMLLFYLQQLPIPIVPPLIDFQRWIQPFYVNGFNFAFDDRLPNQTANQSRCSELLRGFFRFYADFEYETHVICPLYGKSFRKSDVLAQNLPEFQRYYDMLSLNQNLSPLQFNKRICIQDPFELTHSIPGAIANNEFQKIVWKFECAADIIDSELQSNGESTQLLLLLFDVEKFTQFANQKNANQKNANTKPDASTSKPQTAVFRPQNIASMKSTLHIKPTDYHLSKVRDILTKKNTEINAKFDNHAIHQVWSECIVNFLVLILRDIFALKVEKATANDDATTNETTTSDTTLNGSETTPMSTATDTNSDNAEVAEIADVAADTADTADTTASATSIEDDATDRYSKVFNVSGNRDVFLGRKQTKKITIHTLNAEMLDSQERCKNTAWEIQFKATVKIAADLNTFDNVTIEFHDQIKTKKNNFFKTFFTNFDQNLNNLLRIYFVHKSGNTDL